MEHSLTEFPLPNGYVARAVSFDAYRELCARLEPRVFGDYFTFDVRRSLSDERRAEIDRWNRVREALFTLCLGIYLGEEEAGWHFSHQNTEGGVVMRDTGLLPEHRGKGIYSHLVRLLVEEFRRLGFDHVVSDHRATNNAVIIPKLRAGFLIHGLQMDEYGVTLKLIHPFNDAFRESLRVRSGEIRPTGTVAELMGLRPESNR